MLSNIAVRPSQFNFIGILFKVVTKSAQLSEVNYSKLSNEAATLRDHSNRACKCWMWVMIGAVMVVFICKYSVAILFCPLEVGCKTMGLFILYNIYKFILCFSYGFIHESNEEEDIVNTYYTLLYYTKPLIYCSSERGFLLHKNAVIVQSILRLSTKIHHILQKS